MSSNNFFHFSLWNFPLVPPYYQSALLDTVSFSLAPVVHPWNIYPTSAVPPTTVPRAPWSKASASLLDHAGGSLTAPCLPLQSCSHTAAKAVLHWLACQVAPHFTQGHTEVPVVAARTYIVWVSRSHCPPVSSLCFHVSLLAQAGKQASLGAVSSASFPFWPSTSFAYL